MSKKNGMVAETIIKEYKSDTERFCVGIGYRSNKKGREGQFYLFYYLGELKNDEDECQRVGFDGPMFDTTKVSIPDAIEDSVGTLIRFIPNNVKEETELFEILMRYMDMCFWKVTDFVLMIKNRLETLSKDTDSEADNEMSGFREIFETESVILNLNPEIGLAKYDLVESAHIVPADEKCDKFRMEIQSESGNDYTVGFGSEPGCTTKSLAGTLYGLFYEVND